MSVRKHAQLVGFYYPGHKPAEASVYSRQLRMRPFMRYIRTRLIGYECLLLSK